MGKYKGSMLVNDATFIASVATEIYIRLVTIPGKGAEIDLDPQATLGKLAKGSIDGACIMFEELKARTLI